MKGLLIKDLCFLRNQKRLLPVFVLLAVWFTFLLTDHFAFLFLTMMGAILAVSTVSDEEIGHSQAFLFTLPFERRTYIAEKYLLGALLIGAGLALAALCGLARTLFVPDADLSGIGQALLLSLSSGAVILSMMIPMRIRFTGDQGRIILYTVYAVVGLGSVALVRLLPDQKEKAEEFIANNAATLLPALAVCLAAVLLAGSIALSLHWIRKKEF